MQPSNAAQFTTHQHTGTQSTGTQSTGVVGLLVCVVTVALIWCVVLPWVGRFESVRAHIEAMEDGDINVGAMFYSELNWEPPTGAAWR